MDCEQERLLRTGLPESGIPAEEEAADVEAVEAGCFCFCAADEDDDSLLSVSRGWTFLKAV